MLFKPKKCVTVRISAVDTRDDERLKKVMETQKDLKGTDGFHWLESTEQAIDKRKFLLNRLFVKQPISDDED